MHHVTLNCLSSFLVRRLAVAVLRVATKRVLLSNNKRRLWRALQAHTSRPLTLTDSEVLALQQYIRSLSLQLSRAQRNYNHCLAAVARWNLVTSGISLGN